MTDIKTTETQKIAFDDTMHGKYLIFDLEAQVFAIAISYVIDIINVQPITRVPNCPDYIKGITNLRGKVIPIIDLRLRFGKEYKEYNDRTCIIVVEQANMQVGLVADSVAEVLTVPDENISPPPSFSTSSESKYIEGVARVDGCIYLLLNCTEILGQELALADDDSYGN